VILIYNEKYPPYVEYWRSQQGGFHYARQDISGPKNYYLVERWKIVFDRRNGVFNYIPLGKNYLYLIYYVFGFIMGLLIFRFGC
jgi:hypothetical protein